MINCSDTTKAEKVTKPRRYTGDDIVRELEGYITGNHLARGLKLPSGNELAKKYGVSLKTANRAMSILVEKGLIVRKRGSGTFVKSNKTLKQQYRIGLFFWRTTAEESLAELDYAAYGYFTDILTGHLAEHDFTYDIFYEKGPDKNNLRLLRLPLYNYDAIIVPSGMLKPAADYLEKCRVPVILIQDDIVHPGPWHQVIFDYQPGFAAALQHFLRQGHKKFFVVCGDTPIDDGAPRRLEAVMAAAERLHIPSQNLIVHRGGNPIVNSKILCGRNSAEYYCQNKLLKYPVISVSDYFTYGFLSYMAEQNLKLGVDFKLISYDNLEKNFQNPSSKLGISAITHPKEEAAMAVIELLESLLAPNANMDFYRTYTVPAKELVIRSSC